eukprot:gene18282-biopygen5318
MLLRLLSMIWQRASSQLRRAAFSRDDRGVLERSDENLPPEGGGKRSSPPSGGRFPLELYGTRWIRRELFLKAWSSQRSADDRMFSHDPR